MKLVVLDYSKTMERKIIKVDEVTEVIETLHQKKQKIVLVGGCFDIFHIGHLRFLTNAKQLGDMLIILLEADSTVKRLKGAHRPFHRQQDRAEILSALEIVDYVVLLPRKMRDEDYDEMIKIIKPAIIATTKNDPLRFHKERQAKTVGGNVIDVIERLENVSTSTITEDQKAENI